MNVSFYNSSAFKIESNELREKIFLECDSLFGFPLKRDHFPGSQPVTVERKDLPLLQNNYMVCEKSDGERAVLLLLQINNKPMCFMINRNNEIYFIDLSFKKEMYEGSVFDGEIIKTKNENGSWNYLIHDCMIYNGRSFMDVSHRLRYACIIDLITKRYQHKKTDPLNIKTKLFYNFGPGIVKTWEHIQKTTENKIDGLIFTPIYTPIKLGRDNTLFKWKETHTIDFLVKLVSKKIHLYYYKKILTVYRSFGSKDKNYGTIVDFVDENTDLTKGVIIEFKIINGDCFIPYKIRTDKFKPNGEITVLNTLKNIQESITIDELTV
jgi:mRNA guanylyltransferase